MRPPNRKAWRPGAPSLRTPPRGSASSWRADGGRQGPALQSAYTAASFADQDLSGWWPGEYSGQGAIEDDRALMVRRLEDMVRNDGWAGAGVGKLVDALVGGGWVLIATPNPRLLGISDDEAAELAIEIETAYDAYCDDPDLFADRERSNHPGLLDALAMRTRMTRGEAFGIIDWKERGGDYATCLGVIDPDRVSNPPGMMDSPTLREGVVLDGDGVPQGYWIRVAHPSDGFNGDNMRWEYVAREIPSQKRRQVLHAFEPQRAGQRRGIPPFASAVKPGRMLGRYDEVEAQAAFINASMALFIESPYDPNLTEAQWRGDEELNAYQEHRLGLHERNPLRFAGAGAKILAPGEKATLSNPNHPNAVYEQFVRTGLRKYANIFGMTYEQFTGDLSQVNYSSIQAGLIEIKKGFDARHCHFERGWKQPAYAAWLHEAIDRGTIKVPAKAKDFLDAKAGWCSAEWVGPGLGQVDKLKEMQAVRERLALRLTTRRREAAALGLGRVRQIFAERAQEDEGLRASGVDPSVVASGGPSSDGSVQEAGELGPPKSK